jgi:hypothetical protein
MPAPPPPCLPRTEQPGTPFLVLYAPQPIFRRAVGGYTRGLRLGNPPPLPLPALSYENIAGLRCKQELAIGPLTSEEAGRGEARRTALAASKSFFSLLFQTHHHHTIIIISSADGRMTNRESGIHFNLDEKGIKRAKTRKRVFICDLLTLKLKTQFQIFPNSQFPPSPSPSVPSVCVCDSSPIGFSLLSLSLGHHRARLCYDLCVVTSYHLLLCLIDSCEPLNRGDRAPSLFSTAIIAFAG